MNYMGFGALFDQNAQKVLQNISFYKGFEHVENVAGAAGFDPPGFGDCDKTFRAPAEPIRFL